MLAAMTPEEPVPAPVRPIRILAMGGTIAMLGARAQPALDAADLVAALPGLAGAGVEAETVAGLPGAHVGLEDALELARRAVAAANAGAGVVVTHGTDTLEESGFLCDLVYDGEAPIVFTGAIRPASAPGADGPANVLDAVAVAGSAQAAGVGALVVFAGEIHAARAARKTDSTSPAAFTSPGLGPLGYVAEGRVTLAARPARRAALAPRSLDGWVPVVCSGLGEDGRLLRAAVDAGADGVVLVTLGAGHVSPRLLEECQRATERVPVVLTCRPERGAILHATYGFRGSEGDLRASGAIPAGRLSPAGARIKLLACLGAGLHDAELREAFAVDDG
jgi:L-asparaginase